MNNLGFAERQAYWETLAQQYDQILNNLIMAYKHAEWPTSTHLEEYVCTGQSWLGRDKYEVRVTRTVVFALPMIRYIVCEDDRVFTECPNAQSASFQEGVYRPWVDKRPLGTDPSSRGMFVEDVLRVFHQRN
ncbi:MAG: hypothetical protein KA604_01970 [Candidatus Saccharimonas sp.]|nr:hypothetical protein [Candidatus Saccharimonas sp.]